MLRGSRSFAVRITHWRLSLFEKVICVNALMLVGEALVGMWVTSHSLETHHYIIDTGFLVIATCLSLLINIVLLRASFHPLYSLLGTIRAISAGNTEARVVEIPTDSEIGELAEAFNQMLDRLEATQRERAILIVQTQEEERRRLSLELHDESSQNLTALLVHTEILKQMLTSSTAAVETKTREALLSGLQHLTRLTQQTLEAIRTLALQLRPRVLDDLGLLAAFRWLVEDCRQRLQLEVDLQVEQMPDASYPPLHEITLFRLAQEGLTNVARHAQARHATLSLRQDAQRLFLRVRDDGRGYDPAHRRMGLGIAGMQERVALLGGTLRIETQPEQGTTVEIALPLPASSVQERERIYA